MTAVPVTGDVGIALGRKDSRAWKAYSPVYRQGSNGEVITTGGKDFPVRVVAGKFSAMLEPGIVVIENPDGKQYTVTVPEGGGDLWEIIEAAVAYPPETSTEALNAAVSNALPPLVDDALTAQVGPVVTADLEARTPQIIEGSTPGTLQIGIGGAFGPEFEIPSIETIVDAVITRLFGQAVSFTVSGSVTLTPEVTLIEGSTATVHWQWAGGSTSGQTPTIDISGGGVVQMAVLNASGESAAGDVETFNLGFDNSVATGALSPGSGYNLAPQLGVTAIAHLPRMSGLIRFLAAGVTSLTEPLDFTGMASLENIELAGSAVTGVNLTGCTGLKRLCVNGNDLTELDVNPASAELREVRATLQRRGKLSVVDMDDMPNLTYLDLRGAHLNFTEIDALLDRVNSWATSNGTLDVRDNICRSGDSDADAASLVSRGWTLQTDPLVIEPPVVIGYEAVGNPASDDMVFTKSSLPTLQNGDYLVACLRNSATSAGVTDFTCAGFTRLGAALGTVGATSRVVGTYGHVVTNAAAEPSTWTFHLGGAGVRNAGVLLVVRGVDTTNPVSGFEGHPSADDFTSELGSLVIACGANEAATGIAATPSAVDPDYTTVATSQSVPGTTGSRSGIWVGQHTQYSDTAPSAQGTTWASPTALTYWNVSLRGKTAVLRPGFDTVTDAFNKDGATMVHRGGSEMPGNPEMSSRAYDYSALRGFGILEFSAVRTVDGVWFGCHDATINRTSETSGLGNTDTLTWAQVQQKLNSRNSNGAPRPYYLLTEFLDRWTPTHVVFVDAKATGTSLHMPEFLNILDAHGGPEKIVVKFAGPGYTASQRALSAAARGYTTWGYFYEEHHTNGELATYQSAYTTLGINYEASPEAWAAISGYGKKVVAHLIDSQAVYQEAIEAGADMLQCSRPDLIKPVSAS